jgi:DNA-binding MarR family transcriptional regulator
MSEQLSTYQKARLQVVAYRNIQTLATEILSQYGINTSQWVILGWLRDNPEGMRVTGLAEILQVETPLVTSLTQPLQAGGHVQIKVDQLDKRARLLTLTEQGEKLVETAEEVMAERLALLEKGLRKTSLNNYFAALEKFISNYKNLPR